MELTLEQLKQLLPKNPYVNHWDNALSKLLPDYEINTSKRVAAFVAQCAHESGGFMVLKENLNYRAASLRRYFQNTFQMMQLHKNTLRFQTNKKRLQTEFMQTVWAMDLKSLATAGAIVGVD